MACEPGKPALIKVQNNSLAVAAMCILCLEDGIEFKTNKTPLCHLFVVQNTLLSSLKRSNQTKSTARFKCVGRSSNKRPLHVK